MVFFELRWNYSPLKEKAVLLPDGLFICFCRYAALRSTPLYIQSSLCAFLLLMQAARAQVGLAAWVWWTRFVTPLRFAPHRYRFFIFLCGISAADASCGGHGLAVWGVVDKICRFTPRW
jgi:glucan phosphoethanolaminetransferase (alkaline phosphatase superfamily)